MSSYRFQLSRAAHRLAGDYCASTEICIHWAILHIQARSSALPFSEVLLAGAISLSSHPDSPPRTEAFLTGKKVMPKYRRACEVQLRQTQTLFAFLSTPFAELHRPFKVLSLGVAMILLLRKASAKIMECDQTS